MVQRYIFTSQKPGAQTSRAAVPVPPYPKNDNNARITCRLSSHQAATPTVPIVSQTTPPLICTRQRLWQADHHPIKAQQEKIQRQRGADSSSYHFLSTETLPLTEFGADLTLGIPNQFLLVKKKGWKRKKGKKTKPNHTGKSVPPPSFSM